MEAKLTAKENSTLNKICDSEGRKTAPNITWGLDPSTCSLQESSLTKKAQNHMSFLRGKDIFIYINTYARQIDTTAHHCRQGKEDEAHYVC